MTYINKVKPKKSLGQHFLTDESVALRIASTLDDCKGMPVLEVGPGMGVLTKYLLERGHNVTVVEIDGESVEYPYNISSQIFFKILDYKDMIPCCSGMLQKEVAERLAAKPGSKVYGILSVLLRAWYDIEYLFTVDENVFNPPPKVKSGVIKLVRNGVKELGCDEKLFKTIVKTTFGQRRKTIRNSIRGLVPPDVPLPDLPVWGQRPEQLDVDDFVKLANIITELRNSVKKVADEGE